MAFPATYNISYFLGDLYQFAIVPKTAAGALYGITGSTHDGFFYIAPSRGGEASESFDGVITVGTNLITCSITPTVSLDMTVGTTYYYDVRVQNKTNSNEVFTLLTGTINITNKVTDAP
jgi:hypothetical protein